KLRERSRHILFLRERARERDCVFERELRPRPDGEVRRVQRIAQEHDVVMMPMVIFNEQELDPLRVVRQESVPRQIYDEYVCEIVSRLFVCVLAESVARPSLLVALDDEGARRLVELIRVRGKDAVFSLLKGERWAMKGLVRAVPDVTVVPHAQLRLKMCAEARPHLAVYVFRADEQLAPVGVSFRVVRLRPD